MVRTFLLNNFIEAAKDSVLIDVRSEGEFLQGHIPGAINLPLLNNLERAIVGTVYKQKGSQDAIQKGFELVGHKFSKFIEKAREVSVNNSVSLYCWRGGLRSNIMSWVLSVAGLEVILLNGGYKTYRNQALLGLRDTYNFLVLGGKTGSGKTDLLKELKLKGEQVIDLESIANHKGSAFGGIGMPAQPSVEQFENELFWNLRSYNNFRPIWIENESRMVGRLKIPDAIFNQMRSAKIIELIVPMESRVKRIVNDYGQCPLELLEQATQKLEKKLGNLRMNKALEHLKANEKADWATMLIDYYDDFYNYGLSMRAKNSITTIDTSQISDLKIADALLKHSQQGVKAQ